MNARRESGFYRLKPKSPANKASFGWPETLLLMVSAVWGSSYAITKQATYQLPVVEFLAVRFGLTFLFLAPALRPLFNDQWRIGLAIGGVLGGNLLAIFLCETFGVTLTTAANAAFLISLCVGFTPLVEWVMFRRRPSAKSFAAVGLSILGAALLVLTQSAKLSFGWGEGLILIAALLRAVMVCLTRRLAGFHTLPALTLTALQSGVMLIGTILILFVFSFKNPGGVSSPDLAHLPTDHAFWLETMFLVLSCTIFAFFAQNYAASRSNPTRVSLLMGTEPAFGALFAVLWLHESLSLSGWVGGGLIVTAAWWAGRAATK